MRMREGFQADTGKSLEAGMDMACVLWPSVEELALRSSGTRGWAVAAPSSLASLPPSCPLPGGPHYQSDLSQP